MQAAHSEALCSLRCSSYSIWAGQTAAIACVAFRIKHPTATRRTDLQSRMLGAFFVAPFFGELIEPPCCDKVCAPTIVMEEQFLPPDPCAVTGFRPRAPIFSRVKRSEMLA